MSLLLLFANYGTPAEGISTADNATFMEFRDKRILMKYRDKRTKMTFRDKRRIVKAK